VFISLVLAGRACSRLTLSMEQLTKPQRKNGQFISRPSRAERESAAVFGRSKPFVRHSITPYLEILSIHSTSRLLFARSVLLILRTEMLPRNRTRAASLRVSAPPKEYSAHNLLLRRRSYCSVQKPRLIILIQMQTAYCVSHQAAVCHSSAQQVALA